MTIKELESKLQKLDPNLEIVRDRYMKSEVLVIKPDLLAVKGQYFIYDFFNKKFIRNGILKWLNDNDDFAFDKMQSLLNKYLYGSNDYQMISKENNGSTMPFEDDISNDSQKKTKEHLIHDFIEDAALMGFQCSPNQFYDAQTADIDVFDGESKYIMDICFLSGARTFMVDDMQIDDLKRYSWLFTRVSTLINEWRKDEEQKDNQHDNDNH